MSSLQDRIKHLESLIPQKVDYGEIYDFLFLSEQTIGSPPDVSPGEVALRRLGSREVFVNDRRLD